MGVLAEDQPEVSIHAPREGCDKSLADYRKEIAMFQFTHPARGATWLWLCDLACLRIVSIHAPREGCDAFHL